MFETGSKVAKAREAHALDCMRRWINEVFPGQTTSFWCIELYDKRIVHTWYTQKIVSQQ